MHDELNPKLPNRDVLNVGFNSPTDIFVIDSNVWTGPDFTRAYDLKTGKPTVTLSGKRGKVGMSHLRCYRNKASSNYMFTNRDGIEVIHKEKGWQVNNSWVRGTCQYGIMPANGYLYAPPDACRCHPKTKLQGLNVLSSRYPNSVNGKPVSAEGRLTAGHAYKKQESAAVTVGDWTMFRSDPRRSGAVTTDIPARVEAKWSAEVGGKLTQPVSAWGKLFVASIDAHTVYALDASGGKQLWNYSADGRINSAPTLFKGLVIFGSADGHVYAVDQESGQLAWRFHAAPEKHLISIHGQPESSWPVQGSVLLHDDELVFTAGRSSYLDGGLYFYRLDPVTGEMLDTSIICHLDPVTGKQKGAEVARSFDSAGTQADIMSSDGNTVYIKHMGFNKSGKAAKSTQDHLFCGTGLLGEEWFVRTFWVYGTETGAGYFRWANMNGRGKYAPPAGRILSFRDNIVFGYGRIKHESGWAGHRNEAYHLFSSNREVGPAIEAPEPPQTGKKKSSPRKVTNFTWSHQYPLIVRAMVLTNEKLVIAGVPDLFKKNEQRLMYDNPQESLEALKGNRGSYLCIVSSTDGKELSKTEISSSPVFDGMSAANGRLYLSLKDGSVVCLGE